MAFPRFVDVYKAAKVHESYGRIEDRRGATFRLTLQKALASRSRLVQIATWNDWGEGTVIEPSREYGFRDLEVVKSLRRKHIDPSFEPSAADLRLPRRLFDRRRRASRPAQHRELDRVAGWISSGQRSRARSALAVD